MKSVIDVHDMAAGVAMLVMGFVLCAALVGAFIGVAMRVSAWVETIGDVDVRQLLASMAWYWRRSREWLRVRFGGCYHCGAKDFGKSAAGDYCKSCGRWRYVNDSPMTGPEL